MWVIWPAACLPRTGFLMVVKRRALASCLEAEAILFAKGEYRSFRAYLLVEGGPLFNGLS